LDTVLIAYANRERAVHSVKLILTIVILILARTVATVLMGMVDILVIAWMRLEEQIVQAVLKTSIFLSSLLVRLQPKRQQ